MALPDPNKQTFPVIQNPTHYFVPSNCPSPTKTTDSIPLSVKHSSIQLPALVQSGDGDGPRSKDSQPNAANVSLPKVTKKFPLKKTMPTESRGSKIPENFHKIEAEPMPYQCKSFRSTTKMRAVPVSKRHRDMFSAAARSKPGPLAKTKNMAFYTKPFLWQANDKANQPSEMSSLPSRFHEEEEKLLEVRGQKRKYGVPSHRQGYNDLFVGGNTSQMNPKFDYKTEADNLRYMVLPENAQELYMGRGITLPDSHSMNRRRNDWKAKIDSEYTLPNSAPAAATEDPAQMGGASGADPPLTSKPESSSTKPRYSTSHPPPKVTRSRSISHHDSDAHSSLTSERSGPISRKPERRKSHAEGIRRNSEVSRRGSNAGKGQQNEKPRREEGRPVADSKPPASDRAGPDTRQEEEVVDMDEGGDSTVVEVQTIPEEAKETEDAPVVTEEPRPDSVMETDPHQDEEPSRLSLHPGTVSPKGPSPNPLTCIDITLHISSSQKEELSQRFNKLDANQDGHITFQELTSVLPEVLTKSQKKFVKEVYEAVSSSTFFGLEEFIGVTCLADKLTNLTGPAMDAYETVNLTSLQQNIMQFVMMFSSVDRQQTGTISIAALLELLSMVTDKDLVSDRSLTGQILTTIGKDLSSVIDKVEFLAFLPYFFQLR